MSRIRSRAQTSFFSGAVCFSCLNKRDNYNEPHNASQNVKVISMAADQDEQDDQRGQGFPQVLHDRAREAAVELHKHLLSLAVGGVGLYFLALTGKVDPPLTPVQKVIVLFAMISWAVAALSGIISWNADCRRNFFWASALQASDREKRTELYRQRDRWLNDRNSPRNTSLHFSSSVSLRPQRM